MPRYLPFQTDIMPKTLIRFLVLFLLGYGGLGTLYALYVESYQQKGQCDPYTWAITQQSAAFLQFFGQPARATPPSPPATSGNYWPYAHLQILGQKSLRIADGCNGFTVMLIFSLFLLAFPSSWRLTLLFGLFGNLCLYFANLLRLALLAYLTAHGSEAFWYFLHKYLFTGSLYLVVFVLWIVFVRLGRRWPRSPR